MLGWQLVNKAITMFRSVNTASFSIANVNLTVDGDTGNEDYSALDLTNLVPGANIYMGLTVTDTGTSDFRYGMVTTSSGDGVLAKDLRIGVTAVSGGCDQGVYAAGTALSGERQRLDTAAFSGRMLAAGATDHLCFHIQLPLRLPSSLRLKSASATFDFTAVRSLRG